MNKLNDIAKVKNNQAANAKNIVTKLLQKLPENIDETARSYGAIVRQRVVKSATDLILALFIYATPGMSLRLLAASATIMDMASMSDQAWQKKLIKSEPWLCYLLKETIPKMTDKSKAAFKAKSVKLLDGTTIQQAGKLGKKGGQTLRVHMCYNLTEGCMENICVTDKHTAESVTIFNLEANTIYIADAGYGKGKAIAHVVSCKADALFRVTPNHLSLAVDDKGKHKINMAKMLETRANTVDFTCFVHTENKKYVPVRIVASRLPEDKALLAKERKIRNAQRHQTKNMRAETLLYAEWMILMTSLGDDYSVESLFTMYRSRWQIELLFKRIKQSFDISVLPAASLTHSKAIIMLWLILWSYTEQLSLGIELFLLNKDTEITLFSPWTMQRFLFQMLLTTINSMWALHFDSQKHAFDVFARLKNHWSSRENQYANARFA